MQCRYAIAKLKRESDQDITNHSIRGDRLGEVYGNPVCLSFCCWGHLRDVFRDQVKAVWQGWIKAIAQY